MLLILLGDPEATTRRLPILMLPAVIACVITAQFGGFGILTFVHLFGFSVLAAAMGEYKTDNASPAFKSPGIDRPIAKKDYSVAYATSSLYGQTSTRHHCNGLD